MTRCRLVLLGLFMLLPASHNQCTFPSSPGYRVPAGEIARREQETAQRVQLARDCAVDDVALFGEVVRALLERLPSLSYDPLWVSLPHAGGRDAMVDLFLSGGVEYPTMEVGTTATVAAYGSPELDGPRVAADFSITRTETGYRAWNGSYSVSGGTCGFLRIDELDLDVVADSLPGLVVSGGGRIDIGSGDSAPIPNYVSGRVEFDGAGGGTITATYGSPEPNVNLEFTFD